MIVVTYIGCKVLTSHCLNKDVVDSSYNMVVSERWRLTSLNLHSLCQLAYDGKKNRNTL